MKVNKDCLRLVLSIKKNVSQSNVIFFFKKKNSSTNTRFFLNSFTFLEWHFVIDDYMILACLSDKTKIKTLINTLSHAHSHVYLGNVPISWWETKERASKNALHTIILSQWFDQILNWSLILFRGVFLRSQNFFWYQLITGNWKKSGEIRVGMIFPLTFFLI